MRADYEDLLFLTKKKWLSEEEVAYWASLPLMEIPTPVKGEDWGDYFIEEEGDFCEIEDFPFRDFLVKGQWGYCRMTVAEGEEDDEFWIRISLLTMEHIFIECTNRLYDYGQLYDCGDVLANKILIDKSYLSVDLELNGQMTQIPINRFSGYVKHQIPMTLWAVSRFTRWNYTRDRYAITAEKTRKKVKGKGVKKMIRENSVSRIVYLDRLPSASDSKGGKGCERKAHHKRGYWKTLRDKRYARHPKYGIEKGVYVRPSWVGDISSIVNGTTYTVIGTKK